VRGSALKKAAAAPAPRIPSDLAAALRAHEKAFAHFAKFPPSVKRGILAWIADAKRPETRARRIRETAQLADWNVQINQWRW
jgi:uncharacterized protein YdeI (YjbR/CyaY-like superfamily)